MYRQFFLVDATDRPILRGMSSLDFFSTLGRGQDRKGLVAFLFALLGLAGMACGRLLGVNLLVWGGAVGSLAGFVGILWATLRIERQAMERLLAEEQRLKEEAWQNEEDAKNRAAAAAGSMSSSGSR